MWAVTRNEVRGMENSFEQRITELEKRVAELEGRVQAQPNEVININKLRIEKGLKPIPNGEVDLISIK